MNFEAFSFHPLVKAGILKVGYHTPTPIQAQTIPAILAGHDLFGLAQTGTGKTAAFVLPILEHLLEGPRGKLRALIVSPTRELAEQTYVAINTLGRQTGLRSVTLYGGVSAIPQVQTLRAGVDIAVACPGRLLDLMGQKIVRLDTIQTIVLDEADMMFDMGFLPDIRRILNALPASHQTLLFSATMPPEIRALATEFLHQPVTVEIGGLRPVKTVSHAMYPVDQAQKTDLLLALLRQTGDGKVLVFTRTKYRAKKVAEKLVKAGILATSLQGNLSQNRRQESMKQFRSGRARVMVATDIAARGIDVSQVTHVINFDLPDTAEAYTHRIGRTGRMGNLGTALTLTTPEDLPMVRTIEHLLGSPLERRRLSGFEITRHPAANASASVQPRPEVPVRRASSNSRPLVKTAGRA